MLTTESRIGQIKVKRGRSKKLKRNKSDIKEAVHI